MDVLILYLSLAIVGYFIGAFLTRKGIVLKGTGIIQTMALVVLVFVMGSRIGAEESIVKSLGTIGLMALVTTCFVLAGSAGAVFITRKLMGFNKKGMLVRKGVHMQKQNGDRSQPQYEQNDDRHQGLYEHVETETPCDDNKDALTKPPAEKNDAEEKEKTDHTMLLCIFVPVTLGIVAGFFILPQGFIDLSGTMIVVGLSVLLFLVGYDLGVEGTIVDNFRQAGWRVIFFPFVVIAGTYIGSIAAAIVLPISIQDGLCIGSGFGWYTLAPVMLTEYSMEISAISFMHNVLRELMGLLLLPLVAKKIGYIEATGLVGAGSMDVCLPIIVRVTGGHIAVYSFIVGVVLSMAVPVMVSFMMSL